jgi:hypothetical protein
MENHEYIKEVIGMAKKNLIRILAITCLVVSIFFTFGGANIPAMAATEKFPIVAVASPGGSISPAGIIIVSSGSSKVFTIKPAKGFHIVDVQVDGVSVGHVLKYKFENITGPHRIMAFFASGMMINSGAGENGSIVPAGLVKVNAGETQIFTITPEQGYYIAAVIVDGIRVVPVHEYVFKKVSAAHSIIALFNKTYPILASASEGGTVSPPGVTEVNKGDNQTYTISPATGFHLVDVRVDELWVGPGALNNGTYTFLNVSAPHDIAVVFSDKYRIVSNATKGGTITPLGSNEFEAGDNQTYNIIPNSGYYISDLRVDGASVSPVDTYTFTDIKAPHVIVAFFLKGVSPSQAE